MMDIRAFETELEKLRSGFSFDTTKLCGMYVAALARAEAAEAERDEYKLQRDKWIADEPAIEAEAARLRDECSRAEMAAIYFEARVAELEAQLAAAGSRVIELEAAQDESYHAYLELKEEADSRGEPLREACRQNMILTARVAELEAQLAAAHLNPYHTAPLGEHVIVTLRTKGWRDKDGLWDWDDYDDWDVVGWQPLPPPAPDTQEATTP